MAFSPDSRILDMALRPIETVRLPDHGPIRSVENRVSVGDQEMASGRLVDQKDLEESLWLQAFSPTGTRLTVGSARGVRLWNTSEEHIPAP